ncbi:MAG: transglycosylase SLT domain-containing protein [Alistipes sp.]|nr:transglycosylase SLT domain-containing protein [Alistipes sp.]
MLKKTVLTFAFLLFFTSFYGIGTRRDVPAFDDETLNRTDDLQTPVALLPEGQYVISAYDEIIRSISEREGNDWRLMSAIAYHESRFTADIVSRRGARGLMQIMPSVAGQFDVPVETISDPQTNVWLANKLLTKIGSTLRLPAGVSAQDRMALVLAAYNSGIGHVSDARRLARLHGENPDSWEVVARYLALKSEPEYYENEVVRCGRFTGSRQTLAYVNDVMGRYDKYCRMTAR